MKNKLQMICLFLLVALSLPAQRYVGSPLLETSRTTYTVPLYTGVYLHTAEFGASCVTAAPVRNAGTYRSTIYAPFSSETPATAALADNGGMSKRRAFGGGGMGSDYDDDPNRSKESPLGDAWSMLLFAALAAVGIFLRQQRRNTLAQNTKDTTHNA